MGMGAPGATRARSVAVILLPLLLIAATGASAGEEAKDFHAECVALEIDAATEQSIRDTGISTVAALAALGRDAMRKLSLNMGQRNRLAQRAAKAGSAGQGTCTCGAQSRAAVIPGASENLVHRLPSETSLAELLAPFPVDRFWQETYQIETLLVQPGPEERTRKVALFKQLWSWRHIEADLWAKKSDLDEELQKKRAGEHKPGEGLSVDISVDGMKQMASGRMEPMYSNIYDSFSKGLSVVMHDVGKTAPLHGMMSTLEYELGVPIQCNSYITPSERSGARAGFNYHWDDHDSFILQHEGAKLWAVCERAFPLMDGPVYWKEDVEREQKGVTCKNVTLREGDVLYLPMGAMHKAWPTDEASVHLTISISTSQTAWRKVFIKIARRVLLKCATQEEMYEMIVELETAKDRWRMHELYEKQAFDVSVFQAINDEDLPEGIFAQTLVPHLRAALTKAMQLGGLDHISTNSCGKRTAKAVVKKLLSSPDDTKLTKLLHLVLDELRHDYAHYMKPVVLPLMEGPLRSSTRLVRRRRAFAALSLNHFHKPPAHTLSTNGESEQLRPEEFKAYEWALALHSGAKGQPFRVSQIPGGKKLQRRVALRLLSIGLLERYGELPKSLGKEPGASRAA